MAGAASLWIDLVQRDMGFRLQLAHVFGEHNQVKWFRSSKTNNVLIMLAVGFFLVLASAAFLRDAGVIAVRAIRIQRRELQITIPATSTGIVESETEVRVKAEVAGRLVRILVDEGDHVRAGQTLAILDQKEAEAQLNLARANLLAAQARLAQVEAGVQMLATQIQTKIAETSATLEKVAKSLERARSLSADGAIAQEQLDLAKADHEVAKSAHEAALANRDQLQVKKREVEAARAAVEQAAASLKVDEVRLSHTIVTSPIDGLVIKKHASAGETVGLGGGPFFTLGEPLLTLADLGQLWIRSTIDEVDSSKVRVGLSAHVTLDTFPGKTFLGKVVRISPAVSREGPEARTVTVRVAIEGARGLLKPGMSADVQIIVASLPSVLALPTEAILKKEGGSFVYIIQEGRAKLQPLTLGESNWNLTEVKGGVQEGDLAILAPATPGLKDGVRVQADEVETAS
jgi:RND family efflux transporter MFP subunit